ncbi:DNA repair protein RecO [uncultured Duncaniella sp.]|uniref:DNA repair protein RecO n=1 Tax=uncultured Duncaniella sp. TaxID=2768039 RepID=UPI0026768604|nr:DNA repair protein RecO C-terminal domain-containing protein [uncultured Duncaniella sp.]MCI9172643.1 hypothetical protein [Muribaculaceae bacterium]
MKLTFISLKTVRYSDTQSILSAYSLEHGRVSLVVPSGKGKGASRLRALTMPLSVLECETDFRPGREVLPMRQARPVEVFNGIHANPVKQMIAMFLAESLSMLLRESVPDEGVYTFIHSSVKWLDSIPAECSANFHVCFLLNLGRLLGIEPDVSTFRHGYVMDMRDGIWRSSMPLHGEWLASDESSAASMILRMTYSNMSRFRFTRQQRNRTLDLVLRYYSLHLAPLSHLHSLDILRSIS